MVVRDPELIGTPRAKLSPERYALLAFGVRRLRVDLPIDDDLILKRGDVVTVFGPSSRIQAPSRTVGHVERQLEETDLLTFALGVAAGVALGAVSISVGGI